MNYLLIIEYDGTGYSGWQKQPGCRTIQSEIEKAAAKVLGCPIKLTAAGRTDKGVHALAQAANLLTERAIDPVKLKGALNAWLPEDIAVIAIKIVPDAFNARFDARKKIYQYRIWKKDYRSIWAVKYAWWVADPLDLSRMRKAAAYLLGTHDFSSFDASGSTQPNKTATLEKIDIVDKGGYIRITFQADRFLYKMIRNIVGTLVESGRGRMEPERIRKILESRKRTLAGPTAPANGLFFKKVIY